MTEYVEIDGVVYKVKENPPRGYGISPKDFDRCIQRVQMSLRKYHRKGNAFAICTAALKRKSHRRY
jgi:hypothetical protein